MFQPHSTHIYTSENLDSTMMKKPGSLLARKPFVDRSVNSKTPVTNKLQKSKLNISGQVGSISKSKISPKPKEDFNAEEYTYSFKDVADDVYEDIWLGSQYLKTENLIKILRNYCNAGDTPPPSPKHTSIKIDPIFFEVPSLETPIFEPYEEHLDESLEIDLPYLDEAELDVSM